MLISSTPGLFDTVTAGAVTSMSPCVLLMLPALVAVGIQRSRWYPTLVFAAMALAYAATTIAYEYGYANGADIPLSPRKLKKFACYGLCVFGALHLIPWGTLARRVSRSEAWTRDGDGVPRWVDLFDLATAALLGLLVSPLWSPCAGPTLGSILELAQDGETLVTAAPLLLAFGLASMAPVIALSHAATWAVRTRRTRRRFHMIAAVALGVSLLVLSAAVLTKRDKRIESKLLHAFPDFYAWVGSF